MTNDEIFKNLLSQYRRGFEDGLRAFAHWKDGRQYVGTSSEELLQKVIDNMDNVWNYLPPLNIFGETKYE